MSNPETLSRLKERILQLEREKTTLAQAYERLAANQERMEELIATASRKQLTVEMKSMELEQVFSSCADPIWVVREDGIVVRANGALLRLLGRSHDEVVGQPCHKILDSCTHNNASCPLNLAHEPHSHHEWDIERPTDSGESRYYMVSTASLVTIDGSPGIVAQFRDITMRKQAEAALEQANRALSHMARVDGLTQIPNRRAFDEALGREWGRMAREDTPLALIICDIDCFKKYNDHYGHKAGDTCLCNVAHELAGCAQRAADLAARYGGEEFVLLLPQTPLEGARIVAENMRRAVERMGLEHATSPVHSVVTLSVGVASLVPAPGIEPDLLIETADRALYQAKAGGRNRVVCGDFSDEDISLPLNAPF